MGGDLNCHLKTGLEHVREMIVWVVKHPIDRSIFNQSHIGGMANGGCLYLRRSENPVRQLWRNLKDISAVELGAISSRGAIEQSKVEAEEIEHVFAGNVIHTSNNASYLARHVALKAGIPIESPALTLNRLCGPLRLEIPAVSTMGLRL